MWSFIVPLTAFSLPRFPWANLRLAKWALWSEQNQYCSVLAKWIYCYRIEIAASLCDMASTDYSLPFDWRACFHILISGALIVLIMTARSRTSSGYGRQENRTNTTVLLFTLHPNQFVSIFSTKIRWNNYDGGIKYSKMFTLLRLTSVDLE